MNCLINSSLYVYNKNPDNIALSQPRRLHTTDDNKMRIAVASSGLGHICRGIETWADDTANALHSLGIDVYLYQGDGELVTEWAHVVSCWKRFDTKSLKLIDFFRHLGGWRFGAGSGYQLEQTTFSYNLWKLIRNDFDILHVQDPWIAYCFELLHRMNLSKPKVILAHGTEEPDEFLKKFRCIQHLAPCYIDKNTAQKQYAIPNFVNTEMFCPGNKNQARLSLGLPLNKIITICVAAIKTQHKRVDVLIDEYARSIHKQEGILLILGSRETDTDDIIQYGKRILGENVIFKIGVSRTEIPRYYQAADIFALASLHEMMPIAMLEAIATGLPIACNNTPVMSWITGEAGYLNDISQKEALTHQLDRFIDPELRKRCSLKARERAIEYFSSINVVNRMIDMYKDVLNQNT